MKLTARQREILEGLKQAETDPHSECDLVEDGNQVWFGNERTNHATLLVFLRNCLVTPDEFEGGCTYFDINEWGRKVLHDPDFEPGIELMRLIAAAKVAGEGTHEQ